MVPEKIDSRFVFMPIYYLGKNETCATCHEPIQPTGFGQFTECILDRNADLAYHGDCAPVTPLRLPTTVV